MIRTIQTLTTERIVVKVRRDSDNNEFVNQLHVDGVHKSSADYFTDDKADALATADSMLRSTYALLNPN